MARILILQEIPAPFQALRKSLEPYHELVFVENTDHAMHVLQETSVDLIVSMVHLERSSVFEFIKNVKQNPELTQAPLICVCGKRSETAKSLDSTLAKAATTMGAERYVVLDNFFDDEGCDLEKLRREIENCLGKASGP